MTTDGTTEQREQKALQSWGRNAQRQAILKAFEADPKAEPRAVSEHVDAKSAYTVRTRLARRYPGLVFKVIRTQDGTGQICVKHKDDPREWPDQPTSESSG